MSNVDRPSNEVLELLNRLYQSKLTGGYTNQELSSLIVKIGDLISNNIRNGKISDSEVISEISAHLPNERYFKLRHQGINAANNSFKESLEMAMYEREERFSKGLKI